MQLTDGKSLALNLIEGKLSGSGNITVNQYNETGSGDIGASSIESTNVESSNISSNNHFALTKAIYQGKADSKFANVLLDTVQSLDEAVKGAFKKQIANKLTEFKMQVNSGLNEKLAQSLQLNNQKDAEFVNFEALLSDTDNTLEQLKNSDVVKQQKKKLEDKAKDKVKDKLKNKLSDLFG